MILLNRGLIKCLHLYTGVQAAFVANTVILRRLLCDATFILVAMQLLQNDVKEGLEELLKNN